MKKQTSLFSAFLITFLIGSTQALAQASGNIVYDKGHYNNLKSSGTSHNIAISDSTILVEARILFNVLADEYVAIFGVSEEAKTTAECNQRMDKRIMDFIVEIKKLGINNKDYYIDFITQNRVYDYELAGNVATEKRVGFELKKNISIHFKDKELIDKLIRAASKFEIYDIIKVDYIVSDIPKIKLRLFEEAMKVVNAKKTMYAASSNSKLLPRSQVFYENYGSYAPSELYGSYAPSELYGSYTAYESGGVHIQNYQSKSTTVTARKMKTFFFKPIDQSGYDVIINPVIIEPVVQFNYTLKVKFEVDRK